MQDNLNAFNSELDGIEMVKTKLISKLENLENELKKATTMEDIEKIKEQMTTITNVFEKLCKRCNDVFESFCDNLEKGN